jgi:hypothetical protein
MHVRLATVAALSLALVSTPAGALKVKKGNESWGKPGVTFAQYRADALECANLTYGAPIQLTPLPPMPTGLFGVALPNGEWLDLSPGHVKIYTTTLVEGVKHAAWMDVSEQLQKVLDTCLVEKGYTRFRLTAGQMQRLNHLKQTTPERQQFLYRLGSDAAVVVPQRI